MVKEEKKPAELPFVPLVRTSTTLADMLTGKPVVVLRLSHFFPVGSRIYLVENDVRRRASLCTVLEQQGALHTLARRWCWSQGAPEDLQELSYRVATNVEYPLITTGAFVV